MARYPGVRGCALVDATSGLVWHRHPDVDMRGIWEASIDHWRLQKRLSAHFDEQGPAQAIVIHYATADLMGWQTVGGGIDASVPSCLAFS